MPPVRPDSNLRSSRSSDKSLGANPLVVLVRGCKDVLLEAETTLPNTPVTWKVQANESKNKPLAIAADGVNATLKTNVEGSFSAITPLGARKVVWNVVVADHELTGTTITPAGSGDNKDGKRSWEAAIKVKLVGGGADQTLGVDKVRVHILQNITKMTLTGHYTNMERLDTPFMDYPGKVTPNNRSAKREVFTGDDPNALLFNVDEKTKGLLRTITGGDEFRTALASVGDDAPNTILVHTFATRAADFTGTVHVEPDDPKVPGVYAPTGAKTTGSDSFSLLSEGTGGQDVAGFETFPPDSHEQLERFPQ